MTEYGRGSGPEPWHPDDPLYGDQGWNGLQPQQGQVPYGGQYPQEPQHAQPQPHHPFPQSHEPQQQYPGPYPGQQYADQHQGRQQGQPSGQYAQPYPQQQYQDQYTDQYQDQYADPQSGYGSQQHQPQHQPPQHQQQHAPVPAAVQYGGGAGAGGWDGAVPNPFDQQPAAGYPGEAPDLYGTPDAYPPPQPPNRRGQVPEPATEWQDDEPSAADEPEHAFFSGGGGNDDDGDDSEGRGRGGSGGGNGRRGGRTKKKKGRNGVACLFVSLVLVGGVGGVGYYGYSFVKERFGAPEDFAGGGTGSVEIEIPKGASLGQMGRILKDAGVVKSIDAFTAAAQQHETKGLGIQPGLYALKKEMSGAAAVELMVNPANINALDVNPAERNVDVYKKIDKKLGKPEGTTRNIAKNQYKTFGLPTWAAPGPDTKDPLEGFLYPARYDLGKGATPEKLLKQMVTRAASHYNSLDLAPKAEALGLNSPLELVTVASLVAAEGKNHDDYRKMAEVVYNRLKVTNQVTSRRLEFDSTINYIRNESTVDISAKEARALKDPYNTYHVRGLPAGPIGNPGDDAVSGALSPDKGGWMFFISIDGKTTTYTRTLDEHDKLVAEFNKRRKSGG